MTDAKKTRKQTSHPYFGSVRYKNCTVMGSACMSTFYSGLTMPGKEEDSFIALFGIHPQETGRDAMFRDL